jgi:hypothetical protein
MTYAEAIWLRAAQLSGRAVRPYVLAEAVWIIQEGKTGKRPFSLARRQIDDEQVRLLEMALESAE